MPVLKVLAADLAATVRAERASAVWFVSVVGTGLFTGIICTCGVQGTEAVAA